MSDNIKVVVKVRPLIYREIEEKLSYQWRVQNNTLIQLDPNGSDNVHRFTFDKVYDESTNTKDVFNDIAKPIVEAAIAGINGTIFAYGQTSSGKTYTMSGTDSDPGIIPLAVLTLFSMIQNKNDRDFLLRVSYIEIYNETIKDLLDVTKQHIKIHDGHQGVKIDATETVTSSPEEVLDIMKKGEANRRISATNMNEESSRSHTIFQITIESRVHTEGDGQNEGCVNVSTLNLVDLAGSERARQTGATGQRLKEGTFINKSLSTLALVIKQLCDDPNRYANYRDSKLTMILRNSLGGNAKTSVICAVTPAAVEETISTLQFANRAKAIKNNPEVNAVATKATMIQKLTQKLSKLQSQLEVKKTVEQDNQKLKEQIYSLKRQIINGFSERSILLGAERSDRRQTWCASRRATIDTLHTIDEDRGPSRFCTPALKYNPGIVSMFQPTPCGLIPRVSEERGFVTPPPHSDDTNNIEGHDSEVITIMSSPEASKTPPCVLREKAKKAEKNLKDIEELTEREKIYTPSVEELLQNLEQKNCVINELQDEMNNLKKMCDDKDAELDLLNNRLVKTEEELKTSNTLMNNLDENLKKTTAQLTDLEVSLDTHKKKAVTREEELLSLLEEKNIELLKLCSKSLPRVIEKDVHNFMDLSKDISLVNSDNETSTNDDESSSNVQELMIDLQNKLSAKTIMVLELEEKIQKQKDINIELQNSSEKMEILILNLKENLNTITSDNTVLKTTIEQLNATVANQKVSLENFSKEVKSYASLVKVLQSTIIENKQLFDDSFIKEMIANEESFLINNENFRNIIHSLRTTIQMRNEEISSSKDLTKSEIDNKTKEIENLTNEVQHLREQIVENHQEITRLTQISVTNNNLITQVQTVNKQNNEITKSTLLHQLRCNKKCGDELDAIRDENKSFASSLMECNELLTTLQHETALKITGLDTSEMDTRKLNDNVMSTKIAMKENILKLKDDEKIQLDQCNQNKKVNNDCINKVVCTEDEASVSYESSLNVPHTLLKICCGTITDILSGNQESCSSMTNSSQTTIADDTQTDIYSELKQVRQENNNLKETLELFKLANIHLLEEQEMIRKEVSLLVEPAMDLHKKIAKHRTNLSTLTATTYAENKVLQSQVKDLHHHHSRLHNVCHKDIPQYKKLLMELYYTLKTDTAFKRFSLPDALDKNNSTLDGDLLMLDTNDTIANSTDHTLVSHDHSCLDMTQVYLDNDPSVTRDEILDQSNFSVLFNCQEKMSQATDNENPKFIEKNIIKNDATSIHNNLQGNIGCESCKDKIQIMNDLSNELTTVKNQKVELEEKIKNLQFDIPSMENLLQKNALLEKDCYTKDTTIADLTNAISKEKRNLKLIQDENDKLSSQLMEAITEDEILKKELDYLKEDNKRITEKCNQLEAVTNGENIYDTCAERNAKGKQCQQFYATESLQKINCDLDTSLRHNKICTLQNELHASKEDCRKITEEVATIKNHLERSNLSITQNMDDSMGESNIFTFTKDFDEETETSSSQMPDISEEKTSDIYLIDKQDCLDFFVENSVIEKENFNQNLKLLDLMKKFHNNVIIKHGNEVENLTNKLKDFEESNSHLMTQIKHISTEYSKYCKDHEQTVSIVRKNLDELKESLFNISGSDRNANLVSFFKEHVLSIFDKEFSITSTSAFEFLLDSIETKHQNELSSSLEQYTKLHELMEIELKKNNENLIQMKTQLSDKENEYNLLKAQKEKIHEISSVVTLDMIKKEQDLREFITDANTMLLEKKLIEPIDDIFIQAPIKSVKVVFDNIVTKLQQNCDLTTEVEKEKQNSMSEVLKYKSILEEKENELRVDRTQYVKCIESMKQEIEILKNTISEKERLIESLSGEENNHPLIEELLQKIVRYEAELSDLKIVNEVITRENKTYSVELKMAGDSIEAKNKEIAELLKLTQSVKSLIENDKILKTEIDSLIKQVEEAQMKYEEKCKDCSKLEMNIKTHEKSVEIQSCMVKRLQQQKLEDRKCIDELTEKCADLQAELNALQNIQASTQETVISLQELKNTLEVRIKDLETELKNAQNEMPFPDELGANLQSRRRSLHDSKMFFAEDKAEREDDTNKMEAMFASRTKPGDMFMYDDEGSSNKSTPTRNNSGRRRESLIAQTDQSDKEDESRPSSVVAARRRRQSIHDMHRSVLHSSHSPHDTNNMDELFASRTKPGEIFIMNENEGSSNRSSPIKNNSGRRRDSLIAQTDQSDKEDESRPSSVVAARRRRQSIHDMHRSVLHMSHSPHDTNKTEAMLASRTKPREIFMDEDEGSSNRSSPIKNNSGRRRDSLIAQTDQSDKEDESRPSSMVAARRRRQSIHDMHRSVLHTSHSPHESVITTRLQEELDKCENEFSNNSDVTILRASLSAYKDELDELRLRYKELDEECETCAEYLRERDDQCMRLKKEKATLEKTIAELRISLENNSSNQSSSDSKKRGYSNAAVNTDEDWANLHSVVVDRMSFDAEVDKNKNLTKAIEEFRLKNRDLKATIAKMQTLLEKYSKKESSAAAKELENAKKELKSCQQELDDLKQRYRDLDEECETCAEYLRERDEQCKQLKEAKIALEAKLEELEMERANAAAHVPRKKRQSLHDQNRELNSSTVDATTETSKDSYQANGDHSSQGEHNVSDENRRLRMMVKSLSHHKLLLEQKLQVMPAPMYVATGSAIVQNQQFSDIMKENQKLKKINTKLVKICKKRSKSHSEVNRENENIAET